MVINIFQSRMPNLKTYWEITLDIVKGIGWN